MVTSPKIAIEWIPLARLHLSPRNPRVNDAAVEPVAASIRRFGWRQPIVALPSGEVIAGNTRLKAALHLGLTEVPVIWFEGTALDATAYQIADNKTHEFSTWHNQLLADLLGELRAEDALEGVGFDTAAIDELLAGLVNGADPELGIVQDEVPGLPPNATTVKGDLWILGRHRLLCGDSSAPADVDRLVEGKSIQLVNMDPPYNVKVEPRSNNAIAAGLSSFGGTTHHQGLDVARHPGKAKRTSATLRAKDRPLANDFLKGADFDRMLLAWFGNAARVLEPGRAFYIWGGYANCANYPSALVASKLYFAQAIIWNKLHPVLTRKDFMGAHEWCFYGWKEGAAHVFLGPNNATDLWTIKKVNPQSMVHLTEKPVELAARAITYSSREGERVLDLFGGSGSTLIACEQTGRAGRLMELDELYCDVIVERFEKLTGTSAVEEASGKSFGELRAERGAL